MIVIGAFTFLSSCSNVIPIKGNGNIVTSEKPASAFEKISNTSSADVHFHASDEYRVVVTVDENLDEYIEISTRNNVLNIGVKKEYNYSFTKFLVDVYCPVLTGASMTGSGTFEGVDKIISSTFESRVTGSGNIKGTIECNNFSANITGSGNVTVAGTSENANISITGSGNFNSSGFHIKNATVSTTGSGNANISVEENLKVTITGSGEINYIGEPKVESRVTGSGRLNKR